MNDRLLVAVLCAATLLVATAHVVLQCDVADMPTSVTRLDR